jgi:hypothetical protein
MRSNVVQMSNKGLPSKDSIIINTEKKLTPKSYST